MTALTTRINSTASDIAFLRGLLMGVIAAAIVAAALVAAVWFTTQPTRPAQAPTVQRPGSVQIDENHPVVRPGGVKVY